MGVRPLEGGHAAGRGHVSVHVGDKRIPRHPSSRGRMRARFEKILTRYPTKQAALLPALNLAQEVRGHISPQTMDRVGQLLELSSAYVRGGDLLHDVQQAAGRAAPRPGVYQHQLQSVWRPGRARGVPEAHEYGDGRDLARPRVHGDRGGVPGGLRLSDVRPDQLPVLRERDRRRGSADRRPPEGQLALFHRTTVTTRPTPSSLDPPSTRPEGEE